MSLGPQQPVLVETKVWYTSKALWFNLISFVVFVAGLVAEQAGSLNLPVSWVPILGIVVAAGNFLLRLITWQPVAPAKGEHKDVVAHVPPPTITEGFAHPTQPRWSYTDKGES